MKFAEFCCVISTNETQTPPAPGGKKGSAVRIGDVKKELKVEHGLTQQEVQSNLTYLMSQGWVEEDAVEKTFTAPGGTVIPSTISYYKITAVGIDKIEGEGEFTMPKYHGINIEATGQNIITLGDGNQINAKFGKLGNALADLRDALTKTEGAEAEKLSVVADIETIQSQLVKEEPNRSIISAAWQTVKTAAVVGEFANLIQHVGHYIAPFLS